MKTITFNPETHRLVPIEPTEEMIEAFWCAHQHGLGIRAAIEASPQPDESFDQTPAAWSVFNSGAEVASGLYYAEALDYLTPERIARGWCAVCVADKDSIFGAAALHEPENEPHVSLASVNQQSEPVATTKQPGVSEETQIFAIKVEKLLCEKLGRKWSPVGMSIQTLVDELTAEAKQRTAPWIPASTPPTESDGEWVLIRDGDADWCSYEVCYFSDIGTTEGRYWMQIPEGGAA